MWLWHIPEKPPLSLKILLELIQNFAIKIFQTKEYNNYFDEISCFFRKKTCEYLLFTQYNFWMVAVMNLITIIIIFLHLRLRRVKISDEIGKAILVRQFFLVIDIIVLY